MKKLILVLLLISIATWALAGSQKYVRPPVKQVAVTASDVTTYSPALASLWVGTTGNVRLVMTEDRGTYDCTDAPVTVGIVGLMRGRIYQVCATLTTASDLVGYPITNSP